ncbi:MAG: protein-L-isoaspartate O-methyltransferase family protein, partial [Bacillota bacterium]
MQAQKDAMIHEQLINRGIHNQTVINAFKRVPREAFLDDELKPYAYEDTPLRIDNNQTISQPYMVAYMTEALALNASDKVLEIGTGSGYQTAILAEIANEVYTVERIEALSAKAKTILYSMDYSNIHFIIG